MFPWHVIESRKETGFKEEPTVETAKDWPIGDDRLAPTPLPRVDGPGAVAHPYPAGKLPRGMRLRNDRALPCHCPASLTNHPDSPTGVQRSRV